jgi:hypothetical protein
VTAYPYRVVRTFAPPERDDGPQLARVLELPIPPQRGQDMQLPGVPEVLRIARVTVTARLASPTWEPGYRAVELVRVELEPEDADAYAGALTAGWAP